MNTTILTMLMAAVVGQPAETSTEQSTRIYVRTTPPGASITRVEVRMKRSGKASSVQETRPAVETIGRQSDDRLQFQSESLKAARQRYGSQHPKVRALVSALSGEMDVPDSDSMGVLEFRVAANKEEAESYEKTKKDLAWYASLMRKDDGLVARKKGEQNQILLWQTPEKSMTASKPDEKTWKIVQVSVTAEPDRAARIGVVFDQEGGRRLRDLTGGNIGRQIAILVDGKVVSCPRVQAKLGERVEITGNFSKAELNRLAAVLQAGMETHVPRNVDQDLP